MNGAESGDTHTANGSSGSSGIILPSILQISWSRKEANSSQQEAQGQEGEPKVNKNTGESVEANQLVNSSSKEVTKSSSINGKPVKTSKKSSKKIKDNGGETFVGGKRGNHQRIDKYKRTKKFDNSRLLKMLNLFYPERKNLGTIVYNPTTTWETLQYKQLVGLKPENLERLQELSQDYTEKLHDREFNLKSRYISMIPPLPTDYSNSLLEIKIPNRFIKKYFYSKQDYEDSATDSRKLWGGTGGIYSDDSDIISVLLHMGLFNGTINLSQWNKKWISAITPLQYQDGELDLSVTILLLPPIESYAGFYANGINSRSWVGHQQHSGLSYVVYDLKWESCGSYLYDKNIILDTLKEASQDLVYLKQDLDWKDGWKFDKDLYEQLKAKYSKDNKVQGDQKDEEKATANGANEQKAETQDTSREDEKKVNREDNEKKSE